MSFQDDVKQRRQAKQSASAFAGLAKTAIASGREESKVAAKKEAEKRAKAAAVLPKSRKEARDLCKPFYRTGKPCKMGHKAKRNTETMTCTDCEAVKRETAAYEALFNPALQRAIDDKGLGHLALFSLKAIQNWKPAKQYAANQAAKREEIRRWLAQRIESSAVTSLSPETAEAATGALGSNHKTLASSDPVVVEAIVEAMRTFGIGWRTAMKLMPIRNNNDR
ncbi:hypothetical protein [Caballeronia novacaledonica]|uniref:Bacteriophage protein n=1 Tax=Caballeronia novacaledonica TaxID=1544861 RepID=A0AA37I837_9BURK|nr:hypothetical protein [Caballeronia novacaledonica]GJH23808.1 hypothetical protein CBA19CS42_04850 [Caballeronia novacaledonica]